MELIFLAIYLAGAVGTACQLTMVKVLEASMAVDDARRGQYVKVRTGHVVTTILKVVIWPGIFVLGVFNLIFRLFEGV